VYLIGWQAPAPDEEGLGLAEYADRAILECIEAIGAEVGRSKIFLAGHSLGGTLAAIFASLHPERVRGLITLEAPIAFGAGQLEKVLARLPPSATGAVATGNVPGTFLDLGSAYADPLTFNAEPLADWLAASLSPAARRLHWQVRRWSLDETPMARRLFEEVCEALYRENRFAEGRLSVGGRLADPRAIQAPVLAVSDPRSRVVPPASIEAYGTCTASSDVDILEYAGDVGVVLQHVGVLVGANAHRQLWPRILQWLDQRV
jgi:polyhydroxyalkanoate synthase subunit PhaC